MRFSYSRVGVFENCRYRYKLQYIEKLKTIAQTNADNALWLGLGLHKGVEVDVQAGINEYLSHFNLRTDQQIHWAMQLEYQIPRVQDILPEGGQHEVEVKTDNFIGYLDYVTEDTIWDFKFSNAVERYSTSPQLSIYKYFLEHSDTPFDVGSIKHLKFVMVPKVMIRQKKTETLLQFRSRLYDELRKTDIKVIEVPFNMDSVDHFTDTCNQIVGNDNWEKNPSRLCDWCNYQAYCMNGEDWMLL